MTYDLNLKRTEILETVAGSDGWVGVQHVSSRTRFGYQSTRCGLNRLCESGHLKRRGGEGKKNEYQPTTTGLEKVESDDNNLSTECLSH